MSNTQSVSPIINLLPLFLIFIIFYFLIIRPQKNKEKEHQKLLTNLNKNDEVVTSGGIHGTIVNVKEKTVILRNNFSIQHVLLGYIKFNFFFAI